MYSPPVIIVSHEIRAARKSRIYDKSIEIIICTLTVAHQRWTIDDNDELLKKREKRNVDVAAAAPPRQLIYERARVWINMNVYNVPI